MLGEWAGELPVVREPLTFDKCPAPRTEVEFVDRHRRIERLPASTFRHPDGIAPLVRHVADDGIDRRRQMVSATEWIGLVDAVSGAGRDAVPVRRVDAG